MDYEIPIDIVQIQGTADKQRPEIVKMSMSNLRDMFGYLTKYPGDVQSTKDLLTFEDGTILGPYTTDLNSRKSNKLGIIDKRTLTVRVGMSLIVDEVERYRDTYMASLDELGLEPAQLPFAQWYLQTFTDVALKDLATIPWTGVYNGSGSSAVDVADGYLKIIADEITAGNIATGKGNFYKLAGAATDYTSSTIGDQLKAQFQMFDQKTRETGVEIHIPYRYIDMYKEWYKSEYTNITDGDVPTEFLDGTNKKAKFVWTSEMGSTKRVVMVKKGMLVWGTDKANKEFSKIKVFNYENNPYLLAATSKSVIGFQIHSIHAKMFNCNNLA